MKIVIGAGRTVLPGWICYREQDLDITSPNAWAAYFARGSIDAILCEHVLEHLTPDETARALSLAYEYLRPGGFIRVAVPDGYHPSPRYIEHVRPGNVWNGDDHKQLFCIDNLTQTLDRAGLVPYPVEWYDVNGVFYRFPSNFDAPVQRRPGTIWNALQCLVTLTWYSSLIVDGVKR